MNTQKIVATLIFALTTVSFNASAAIINQVDFPDSFIQTKEKVNTAETEQVTASAEAK